MSVYKNNTECVPTSSTTCAILSESNNEPSVATENSMPDAAGAIALISNKRNICTEAVNDAVPRGENVSTDSAPPAELTMCDVVAPAQAPCNTQFLSSTVVEMNAGNGAASLPSEQASMRVTHSSALDIISMFEPDPQALRNLIVNYLPPLMDEGQMYQLFSQFGPIDSVKIIYDKQTRVSRGYGFLKFMYFFSATYAIACLNRFQIAGKRLKVAYANAEAAKQALQTLREQKLKTFSPQQKIAYTTMYNNQMLHTQD